MSALRTFAVTSSRIPRQTTRAVVDAIRVIRNDTACLEQQINRLRLWGTQVRTQELRCGHAVGRADQRRWWESSSSTKPGEYIDLTEQSERIPVTDDYLRALGRATYNFVYLEWAIVWLTETLQPGFVRTVSTMTAGKIGKRFSEAVGNLDDAVPDKDRLQELTRDFAELVTDRNSLVHATPHTSPTDEQRLLYGGRHGRQDWTIDTMTGFSSRTAMASIKATKLLHNGLLQQYQARKS